MSDEQYDDKTRRESPRGDEIPRRGYERRRDPTPSPTQSQRTEPPPMMPPPPATPPPVYGDPQPVRYGPRPGTPAPPRRGRDGRRAPRDSGLYLPWWSLVILIVFVGVAAFSILVIVANLSTNSIGNQTPQFVVVTSAINPGVGQNLGLPTGIPTEPPTAVPILPTISASRTPLPGGCLLNAEVVVFNTGPVGLNLREEPRLSGERLWVAQEGNVLKVIDGPQFFDDFEWCKVESITRPGQVGWGVIDFMIAADAVETPDGQ